MLYFSVLTFMIKSVETLVLTLNENARVIKLTCIYLQNMELLLYNLIFM